MLLPSFYFGPAFYHHLLCLNSPVQINTSEHFIKQSFRNRMSIYTSNGILNLSIPLKKWNRHSQLSDIQISYAEDWQTNHWRSLEAAYNRSPFFEYYEEEFKRLYSFRIDSLLKWNTLCLDTIIKLLNLNIDYTFNKEDIKDDSLKTSLLSAKKSTVLEDYQFPFYLQTFNEKYGFIPNLSIIDVLFNLGAETTAYLKSVTPK